MNGSNVESGAQLRRMIRETPPGRMVSFGVSRDGQPLTIKVQLADRRKRCHGTPRQGLQVPDAGHAQHPGFELPMSVVVVHSSLRSGLMVGNITPQLGRLLRGQERKRRVDPLRRKRQPGGKKRDFVRAMSSWRVNQQAVHDTSDFSHALRSSSNGTVTVGIIREKKEQTITLPLPDRRDSGDLFEESFDCSRGRRHRNANEPEPSARGARAGSGRKCNMPCRNRAVRLEKNRARNRARPARSPGKKSSARGPKSNAPFVKHGRD